MSNCGEPWLRSALQAIYSTYFLARAAHSSIATTLDTDSHIIPGMGEHTARAMEDAPREDVQEEKDAEDASEG